MVKMKKNDKMFSSRVTEFRKTTLSGNTSEEHVAQLWYAFKRGDEEAFAQLMEFHYPALLNYGCRFQKDREFVKDCIQDLFLEFWKSREKLGEVLTPRSYLLVSLRRKLLREKGRIRWFREAGELSNDYCFEVQLAIESYLINNEIQHEDLKKLRRSLEQLTKRQREAIYLRFYQELGYEEIARTMGINNHSAVNLVYEAIKFIRENWIYP
jgi:RNA polymerase sigma factor (sigma-70 family)